MKKLKKLSLKQLKDKMPVIENEMMKQINGGDVTVTFDRSDGMIYIYVDGIQMDSYSAGNNVASNATGNWTNGTYNMMDTTGTYNHTSGDTFSGSYGINGIYRADPFYDASGCYRTGMGLHAGRDGNVDYPTMGCIRTTEEAMNSLQDYIDEYGNFTEITVRD